MASRRVPLWLAVLAAALPMFMTTLDNLVVTTALPAIHRDLGAGIDDLQWVTNAYTLAFAALMLFAVGLGDRFGRRRLFVIGIVVFTAASAAAALSDSTAWLITARALQGVGAAAVLPLSLALLAAAVPDRLRPAAIGIWGGVSGLGVALGPVIGGAVVQGWSWSAIFWLNVPVGIIAVPLAILALPEGFGARARADVPGVVLASTGITAVVYGLVRGNDLGWTSAAILTALLGGAVLLAAFLVWESRTASPLLPLRLFRIRSFSVSNAIGLVFSFGAFGSVFLLVQFLQVVQGKSPLTAGLMTMPWTLAPMVVAPLAGLIAPRVGTRLLIGTGLASLAAGIGWIGLVLADDVTYGAMLPGFVLAGIGMGLVFAPISTAVLADVQPDDHAKASGTNSTLREIGTALGVAVLTAVFTGAGGTLTPTGFTAAAQPAVLTGAAVTALAALLAILLPSGRAPRTTPTSEPAQPAALPAPAATPVPAA
ncbi:MAG TPA: DHA2 family efflux MFS transporter permease subunit [Amnibacterium sp.]|jgi:EmrB/QacA subfamily drug resistance transporter|uniref:DHA2 family efflux MFS transporter permease subunit n=1 Tax=Amnibacterium sp. TaxID=1872496 RepID=UPI002F94B7F9